MQRTIASDDLRYVIFSEIYLKYGEPKTQRRAFAVLESAISCFQKKGFGAVTFKMIARESGMAPPSLRHYFTNLSAIEEFTIKYVHVTAQRMVVGSLLRSHEPLEMLKLYLEAHLYWATHFRSHLNVWLNFILYSSRLKKHLALNTQAVLNGAERISEILLKGREAGVFFHSNDFEAARIIQTMILGWLMTLVTEEMDDPKVYSQMMLHQCLKVVQPSA